VGTITRLSIALWPNLQVKRCRSAALAAFYPSWRSARFSTRSRRRL